MAALPQDFDPETEKPREPMEAIPVGEYAVVIVDSEEKENSKKTGSFHQFTLEVIDGDYKGRKLFARLNLNNPNDVAVGIARAELAEICKAVGVMKPKDSTDLHNLPMRIKVGMEKRKDNGEMSNVIKGYIAKEAAAPKAAPATPPWKRKA